MINLNSLAKVINGLEYPDRVDQRICIAMPDRVDEINTKLITDDGIDPPAVAKVMRKYTLVAVRYCRSQHDCWLEWELDI